MSEVDHTVATQSTGGTQATSLAISPAERAVLRNLVTQVAELAARPIEQEKRDLWYRHNALEPTRPVIFCDPEGSWKEIIPADTLACTGALARGWEFLLRREIFWGSEMCDDRVIMPTFDVAHVYTESDWGMASVKIGGQEGGSYVWEAPLQSYEDLDKLRFPQISVDHEATERVLALAHDTLGDLLKVRLKNPWWWTLGMTWTLIDLRGLQQMMLDMLDHPDELHRLMAFLRDGHLARLDFLQQNGLLSLNTDGAYVGSGGFGWTHELPQPDCDAEHVRPIDLWGCATAQIFSGVSPEMHEAFALQYERRWLERFGLNYYGCCEPLDRKVELLQSVPRLRKISMSPWVQMDRAAENVGQRLVFSWKPSPAIFAEDHWQPDRAREMLIEGLERTRGCVVEVIMKDVSTVRYEPQRLWAWAEIAAQVTEQFA